MRSSGRHEEPSLKLCRGCSPIVHLRIVLAGLFTSSTRVISPTELITGVECSDDVKVKALKRRIFLFESAHRLIFLDRRGGM